MIRLTAYNQANTRQYDLDLFGDETIAVTLTIDDLRDISSKNASFTKDFDLPATKNNNKFFAQVFDLQVDSTYNPYKKTRAAITENGVEVFSGSMYLNEVLDKEGSISYRVNVYSETVDFIEALGEATLADLDYTDLAHTYNEANVEASWGATGVTLAAGGTTTDVFYPLVDVGNVYLSGGIQFNSSYNYTPFVSAKYILDKIFEYANFTYESLFFNSDYFKAIYTDTFLDDQTNNYTYGLVDLDFVYLTSPSLTLSSSLQAVPLSIEVTDANNLWNNSTYTYTAPADNVDVTVYQNLAWTGDIGDVIEVYVSTTIGGTTTDILVDTRTITMPAGITTLTSYRTDTWAVDQYNLPNAGDTIQIKAKATTGTPSLRTESAYFDYTVSPPVETYTVTTNAYFETFTNAQSIDERMTRYKDDAKLSDIFKDFSKMFNLYVEPLNNRLLKVEPYEDYLATGTTLYWDDKIDFTELKQEFVEIPSKLTFLYNNDEDDKGLQNWEQFAGVPQGSYSVYPATDVNNEQEIKLELFSATFTNYTGYSSVFKEEDAQYVPLDNKPRLLFKSSNPLATANTDSLNVITSAYIGSASYLSDVGGAEFSLEFGTLTTAEDLYTRFWHTYVQDKYTQDAVVITVIAKLSAGDITGFSFADKIVIQNQAYRVNKIEYLVGKAELAKLELYKVTN